MDVESVKLSSERIKTISVDELAEHIFSVIKKASGDKVWYRNYPTVLSNLLLQLCRDSEGNFSQDEVNRLSPRFDEAIALLKGRGLLVDAVTPYTHTPTVRLSSLGEKSDGREIRFQQKDISRDMAASVDTEQKIQNQKGEGIKVFISNRWAEGEHDFARELSKKLMNYDDIILLLDEYEMLPGDSIRGWMNDAIQKGCDVFLSLMSPSFLSSENCLYELDLALKTGLPIIPVLVRDCEVPDSLRDILFADFREDLSLPFHLVDRLVKGIRRQAGKLQYNQANKAMEEEVINLLQKINPLIVKELDVGKRISVVANSEDYADLARLNDSYGMLRIEPASNTIIGYQAGRNLGIYTVRDNYGAKVHFYLSLF